MSKTDKMSHIFISNVTNIKFKINYPVRIHSYESCQCQRLIDKNATLSLTDDVSIVYVIEKIWDDCEYKHNPKLIYVIKSKTSDDANDILKYLFSKQITLRKHIREYFDNYDWSETKSKIIRHKLKKMNTICFCQNNKMSNASTYNSGIIIIGDECHVTNLSNCFNKLEKKTEFANLCKIKIQDLSGIPENQREYTINMLLQDPEFFKLDQEKFTFVGKKIYSEQHLKDQTILSFSFGKKEWYPDNNETTFVCAKRELFEEFNIQFSEKIFLHGQSINQPQFIHNQGYVFHMIHLPKDISIKYYNSCDTIYIDCM